MYLYFATVLRVRDGDTIEVDIDLGLYAHLRAALRLKDVDAPELVGSGREAGLLAKAHLESMIPIGDVVRVQTYRRPNAERYVQTFDRFVADVWILDDTHVNEEMRMWLTTQL